MNNSVWGPLQWEKNPSASDWDRALAFLGGHPLQSCLWGDARHEIEGIVQHRWLVWRGGEPVWMIRVEERRLLGVKIAWAPRGPTGRTAALSLSMPPGFDARIKAEGFALIVCDPWVRAEDGNPTDSRRFGHPPQTIWLDLSMGRDVVFKNLHKHFRNGVRRASKARVSVGTTGDPDKIREFVDLCRRISARKGFELRVTAEFVKMLLNNSRDDGDSEAALFVASKDGELGAGLIILRLGRSVHMISAGTNRGLRQDRVGEACQWGVIEWAIGRGCTLYDLEGIDPINNRSVYEFKKRLGGEEVNLHGYACSPISFPGRVIMPFLRLQARLRKSALHPPTSDQNSKDRNWWPQGG